MDFLTKHKIPVGWLSEQVVLWLKLYAAAFFSLVRMCFGACLDATYALFMNPPPILFFIVLTAIILLPSAWSLSYIRRFLLILGFSLIVMVDYAVCGGKPVLSCAALFALSCFVVLKRRVLFPYLAPIRAWGALCVAAIAPCFCFWIAVFVPSAIVFIALLSIVAWLLQERWSVIALVVASFLFIVNQGYWRDTMETLTILLWSCIFCLGLGLPLGILAAHHRRAYRVLQPILDLMQTLPAFVYLIPALFFFRIGMVPGLIATVIFVLPTPIRLCQAGIASVPKILLEAAQAFGANKTQLLWKVELPHALPEIRAAMTQTIMLSLSMVVITATVGGNGLGVKVYRALQTGNIAQGFEAGCVIVIVAIVLDRVFRLRTI